jgi:glycerol-3-phosphate dehydrogenase
MISSAQIDGIVRGVLALVSGIAIAWGIGDAATWAIITGAIVSLATAAWSIYSNSQAQLIGQVASDDEVKAVIVDTPKLADSIPNDKVVSST